MILKMDTQEEETSVEWTNCVTPATNFEFLGTDKTLMAIYKQKPCQMHEYKTILLT